MNTINYYDWQRIYNDLAYTFVDLVSNIKYGDEKMDIEKLKKEINDIKIEKNNCKTFTTIHFKPFSQII